MCFIIQADVTGTTAEVREKLTGVVPRTDGQVEWNLSDAKGKPLQLDAPKVYCTCFLVAGGAEAQDPAIWPLHADWAPQIAEAVSWLYSKSDRGIVLWAVFAGDKPRNERSCSIDELLSSIESRELANRTRYIVRKKRR